MYHWTAVLENIDRIVGMSPLPVTHRKNNYFRFRIAIFVLPINRESAGDIRI